MAKKEQQSKSEQIQVRVDEKTSRIASLQTMREGVDRKLADARIDVARALADADEKTITLLRQRVNDLSRESEEIGTAMRSLTEECAELTTQLKAAQVVEHRAAGEQFEVEAYRLMDEMEKHILKLRNEVIGPLDSKMREACRQANDHLNRARHLEGDNWPKTDVSPSIGMHNVAWHVWDYQPYVKPAPR